MPVNHRHAGPAVPKWSGRLLATGTLLACVLAAAHHLRFGELDAVFGWLVLVGACMVRFGPARVLLGAGLVLALLQWGQVTMGLVAMRSAMGEDPARLVVIMGVVMALTLAMALLHAAPVSRRWYGADSNDITAGLAGTAVGLLLLWLRHAVHIDGAPLLVADRFLTPFGPLGALQCVVGALGTAWVARVYLSAQHPARVRVRLWLGFSVLFFGQLVLGLVVDQRFLLSGKLHLPVPALIIGGPLYRGEGLFMLWLFGSTLLLVGPAWCSHLCYAGAWDALAARVRTAGPPLSPRLLWGLRGAVLALVVLVALGLRWLQAGWPVAVAWGAVFGVAGVVVVATASRSAGRMVHCTVLCPIGLVAGVAGRISPWRVRVHAPGACTGCGACERACGYSALRVSQAREGGTVHGPGYSCTLCGDCTSACPKGVLGYGLMYRAPGGAGRSQTVRNAFVAVTMVVYGLFCLAARL